MSFKSEAQRRKFQELVRTGQVSKFEYEKRDKETGAAELPDRVTSKHKATKVRAPKSKMPKGWRG